MYHEDICDSCFEEESVIENDLDISFKKGQDYFFNLIDKIVSAIDKIEKTNSPTSPN